MNRFAGRTAIVTGAAGSIGAASAVRLAQEGARIGLLDRTPDDGLEPVVEACQAFGVDVVAVVVDQTDRHAVDEGIERVAASLGGVDVLFANAGYGKASSFLDQSVRDWQRHVDVNLTGTFHVCQAVARRMVEQQRGGSIVLNASSGAEQYSDLLGAYCATKAGLRMLAIGMASELGAHRIRVNAILPGVIETGMTAPLLSNLDGVRESLLSNTPVGRLGAPDDIASLVAFLASDEASFITGGAFRIDGGQTIHGYPQWYRTDYRAAHQDTWETP